MPIADMPELLHDARRGKYAVGCFNAINLDMIRGVLAAAKEEQAPVILCHAEVHFKYTPLEQIAPILVREASQAKTPVALLLDHGHTFNVIVQAMKLGFNAIMYDGSGLDYGKNAANTREIVKIARAMGASVEAELGHVTRPRSGGAEGEEDDGVVEDRSLYTDPEQAAAFVRETGADALAVAFGTAHGVYLKKPELDFARLDAIRRAVDAPLVMHGGSGLTEENFTKAIDNGISKINYYTGMAVFAAERIRNELGKAEGNVFYHNLMMASIDACREDASRAMRQFRSSGKA